MENSEAKNLIVEVLQNALSGQMKLESTIKPSDLADTILHKVEFSSTFAENGNKNLYINFNALRIAAEEEYEKLGNLEANKLLRNFVRGKIEAYEEMLSILKK